MLLDLQEVAQNTAAASLSVAQTPDRLFALLTFTRPSLLWGTSSINSVKAKARACLVFTQQCFNMRHNICKEHSCPLGKWLNQGHIRHCGTSLEL